MQDRTALPFKDCIGRELDGRQVWRCADGTFEVDPVTGGPDRSRRIHHQWPTLDEVLAAADRDQEIAE